MATLSLSLLLLLAAGARFADAQGQDYQQLTLESCRPALPMDEQCERIYNQTLPFRAEMDYPFNLTEATLVYDWSSQAYGTCVMYSTVSFFPCTLRGTECDEDGRIIAIHMPPCATELEPLPLPEGLSALERLERLTLEGNLRGSIPQAWTGLQRLQSLALLGSVTGLLPAEFSSMTSLTRFSLADSHVMGSLPESWSAMTQLQVLNLVDNRGLGGSLPTSYSTLTALEWLGVLNSNLTGTLPRAYSMMSSLKRLVLRDNALTGTIPAQWSGMLSLIGIDMKSNRLSGSLPASLFRSGMPLQKLDLSDNVLSGSLPAEWTAARRMNQLAIAGNRLTGTLPPMLAGLSLLSFVALLPLLTVHDRRDVHNNQLTGTVPEEWSRMIFLSELIAGYNQLSGTLPPSFSHFIRIRQLSMENNRLTGSIPLAWGTMSYLYSLKLGNNNLTGILPQSRFPRIRIMSLHNNQLSGTIPRRYKPILSDLIQMDLSANNLEGALPQQLILDRNSRLNGTLPAEWSLMSDITEMSLGGTDVSGSIPPSFSAWRQLRELRMPRNRLSGSLPSAFSTWTDLTNLHLHENYGMTGGAAGGAVRIDGTPNPHFVQHQLSWSVMADLQLLAVPPQLCDSLETDVLQEAAASAGSCTMRALDDSPLDEVLIGVVASVCTAVLLLAVLGVAVAAHRSHCEDPQCAHRHPGLVHSLVGHLSPGTRSAQCAWCMWDGKPDLAVPFAELEPLLEPHAVIGRGGFSKVFRGTWRGRPVAIKLLDMSALGGDEATQRAALANEIDLSVRCNECPHMVRLYGACPEGVCLINELVDGGTLDARIHGDAAAPMQLLEALHVARDIAGGLVFLHPQLVHRDSQAAEYPSLLHDGRAKIIDFGLGRVNENPAADARHHRLRGHRGVHGAGAERRPRVAE
eukprot:jgi/Tetstr1/435786/TSEL_024677.t1